MVRNGAFQDEDTVILKGSAFLMPKAAGMSSAAFDFAPRQIPECFQQGAFD